MMAKSVAAGHMMRHVGGRLRNRRRRHEAAGVSRLLHGILCAHCQTTIDTMPASCAPVVCRPLPDMQRVDPAGLGVLKSFLAPP